MPTEPAPQPPAIPDYELLRLIGRGAYGEVWLARGVTGVYRAVKLVWRDRFPEAGPYEREFHGLREFAAISLSESRQLALLHVGRDPAAAYFYYVMELADDVVTGREINPANYTPHTLKETRARRGRLPAGECIALGAELARALGGLHARGLVHRDIKPSNVIFVGGAPKLADIGLVTAASAALTFVGTEGFVPPEGPGAPAADVFALGKLLYELATGLDRHDYPRLPAELHTWPDRKEALELNEVLIRACEPHADRRHPDAAALLDDLLLLQAGRSLRRLRKAERRLARTLKIAAVLTLIAGVAGLGAYVERQRANQEMALRARAEAERDALARRVVYNNTVGNAQLAIQREEFGQARQLLLEARPRAGDPDLRGFEWAYLQGAAQGDPAQILRKSGAAIDKLDQTRDGKLLAVHTKDLTVALHDQATLAETRKISGILALGGFSADGNWLLGTGPKGLPQRWRVADGETAGPATTRLHQRILGVQHGEQLVAFNDGNPAELLVWDFSTGREARHLLFESTSSEPRWDFFRGDLSPEGDQVVLAWVRGRGSRAEFRLTLVDLRGTEPRIVQTAIPERPSSVGFDATGAWAAQWDTGNLWRCPVANLAWLPGNETLFRDIRKILPTGASDRLAIDRERLYWIDASGRVIRRGRGHQGIIGDVLVSARDGRVFSGSHDGELRLWPLTATVPAKEQKRIWNSRGGATRVVFSPDSRQLLVPVDGHSVEVLDSQTLQAVARLDGLRYPVWTSGQKTVGLAAVGGGYAITSTDHPAPQTGLPAALGQIHLLTDRDGRRICLSDSSGKLWWEEAGHPANGPVVASGFENRFALRGNATLTRLWTSGSDNILRCLSLPDAREIWTVKLPALAPSVGLSPDEKLLLVPLESSRVEVRAADTGALLRTVTIGGSTPQDVALSPNGDRLFAAGSKGDIACLETSGWSQIALLQLPTEESLHTLAMSPDGTMLAAVTKTGALHLLRARP